MDYVTLGTSAIIPAGQSSVALAVTPIDDALVEGTETVTLSLGSSATYALGAITAASVNILDNDTSALPVVTVAATQPNAAEPSTSGQWTLTRTGSTASALVVAFTTTGTAARAVDYTLTGPSGTNMTIAAGQSSAVITLNVTNDTLVEGTETAIFNIATSANYTVGSPASATISIADDDSGGTQPVVTVVASSPNAAEPSTNGAWTLTRTGDTSAALTVNFTLGGTATRNTDYTVNAPPSGTTLTFAAGSATLVVPLVVVDDSLAEGTETAVFTVASGSGYTVGSPASATVNIADDDSTGPRTTTGVIFATHTSGANTRDIKLNVYRPATGSGPWPTILYFPGGGWTSQSEGSVPQFLINFTANGYAVVSANYVTSSFAKWPAQIQDTKAAVRWVRANAVAYGFDPNHIGITGSSSGGHLCAYTGLTGGLKTARCGSEVIDLVGSIGGNLTQSDAVQAAAPFYPPTDLLAMDRYPTPDVPDHNGSSPETGLIGAPIQTVPEKTGTANPIIHVRAGAPPFWITQGTADRSVDFNQSELLNAALVNAGQPVTLWPVLNAGHGIGVIDNQEVFLLLRAFFDRTLKGLSVNPLPVPNFTASALTGTAPLTVTFDGSASTAPAGVITKYSWSSGDDTGGGNATLTYTYTHAGVYPVTLAVQDDQGGTASKTVNVVVYPHTENGPNAPTCTITSPAEGFLTASSGSFVATLNASALSGTISAAEFWLNDQPIAWDSKSPYIATFAALAPGRYRLTARVSDTTGNSFTPAAVNFRVLAPADVEMQPSVTSGMLSIQYYRFTDGPVAYATQRSADLTGWTTFTPTETVLQTFPSIEVRKATDPLPIGSDPRRFLRMQITAP